MTIETLARYLGRPVADMLGDMPFKFWPVEESHEEDLNPPLTNYEFPENGLSVTCDKAVRAIFLQSEEFDEYLLGFPFSLTRQQIRERFGTPTRSGVKHTDEILGEMGNWDRFDGPEYAVHVEFWPDADRIKMITLMRPDVAP